MNTLREKETVVDGHLEGMVQRRRALKRLERVSRTRRGRGGGGGGQSRV